MKWNLDSSHSSIEFTVKHMALTSVRGRFTDFSGEGRTDERGVLQWVKVVIKADSLNTAEPQRDAHLRSADFFEVETYPEIIFESSEIKLISPDRYEVKGNLNMHGVSKPLQLTLTTTNPVRGMYGEVRVGGQSQGTFRRKDWGLTWNQMLEFGGVVVSDEVWFSVTLQAIPEAVPNYRVRWALASPDDRYQVALRYGRNHRLQGELQGVTGWFDVLDGRPISLQAEFPLSELKLPLAGLPSAAANFLTKGQKVTLDIPTFESHQPGVHEAVGTLNVGIISVPVNMKVENINLPGGNSSSLTARASVSVDAASAARLGSAHGLNLNSSEGGLQATLWFMAKAKQEFSEMALS